jgi:hypothetical protein
MSEFSTAHFATKLSTLHSASPPSQIQALAAYLSPLHPHALQIAQAWQQQFVSSSSLRQLSLLYLVNELLHTAKRQQQSELLSVLGDVLPPCLLLLWGGAAGDDKVRERVRRVVDVWRSRNFFSQQWDEEMRQRAGLPPPEKVEKGQKTERKQADRPDHKRKRRDSEPAPPPAAAAAPPSPPAPSPPAAPPAADDPVISLLTELHRELAADEAAYERVRAARTVSTVRGEEESSTREIQEAEAALMLRLRQQLERRERLLLLLHDSVDSQQAAIAQLHTRIQDTLPLQQPAQRPASHLPTSVLIPLPYVPPSSASPTPAAAVSSPRAMAGRGGGGAYGQAAYARYGGNAVMQGFGNGAAGIGIAGGIPFRS